MAGQTRVDTHTQKKDATHKRKSDTPAQNTTHCLGSFRLSVGPMLSRDNQFVPTNNRLLAFAVSHFLLSSLLLVTLISVEERLQASSLQISRYFLGGDPTVTDFSFHGRRAIKQ